MDALEMKPAFAINRSLFKKLILSEMALMPSLNFEIISFMTYQFLKVT
jgi:hypothetical protein